MTVNKNGKLYVVHLLAVSLLIFSSGVSGHKAAGQTSSTDAALERRVAVIMKQAAGQRRRSLTYNPILARVARQRAYDMGQRNYFGHVNPDGIGPNYLVTREGYVLPDFYGKNRSSNNIESIEAGSETAERAWDIWMGSTGHRTHLLGLTEFHAEQTEYGVGHAFIPNSRYRHYWVVITAKPGGNSSSSVPGVADLFNPKIRSESASPYPNVIRGANGKLKPASSYVWVDDNDPNDFRVKLMPGLIRTGNGKLRPASGYVWASDEPKDFRVRLMPGLVRTENGCLRPARGYRWVDPKDPQDFRVEPIP